MFFTTSAPIRSAKSFNPSFEIPQLQIPGKFKLRNGEFGFNPSFEILEPAGRLRLGHAVEQFQSFF